ncbi:S26 family signal peptidase [Mycolicibacterium chlorophenolicum]|nr:S26 family signal peptidase [Mycolicibacterium chlorophenolicum]
MRRNQGRRLFPHGSPVRRFVVVEDSMRPTLVPGDGLLAVRCGTPKTGQLRVFPDPRMSTRYLIKRVGGVRRSPEGTTFEAVSDNAGAPGVTDSRVFGWVPAAQSYRVLWTVRSAR